MLREVGTVEALWRYPFKSMLGERLPETGVTSRGLVADRQYAWRERATHKLATARHYPQLLSYRATWSDEAQATTIQFPDGSRRGVDDPELESLFSSALSKGVVLEHAFGERTPQGLFDDSHVHIISKQTLEALEQERSESRFDARRFRPNVVVDCGSLLGKPEQSWLGKKLRIGADVVLQIEKPCERCVMTTMPQEDLPRDNEVLRTVAQTASNIVGIYGNVVTAGIIRVGDSVVLLDDSGY